jgi:hypothetical protein
MQSYFTKQQLQQYTNPNLHPGIHTPTASHHERSFCRANSTGSVVLVLKMLPVLLPHTSMKPCSADGHTRHNNPWTAQSTANRMRHVAKQAAPYPQCKHSTIQA